MQNTNCRQCLFLYITKNQEGAKIGTIELLLLSVGLAMDAFAVSICKGISMKKMNWKKALIIGLYFGGFQALMPVIGYFLGTAFESIITNIDHWVAFILLGIIGGNMIKESFEDESDSCNDDVGFKTMVILAIATSIDALTVGITFAFLKVNLIAAISMIGVITLALSVIGTKIGNKFGNKYKNKAELVGGIILVLLGIKILLEHLF